MFESIESTLYPIVCDINTYLSNYILVFLLLGQRLGGQLVHIGQHVRLFKAHERGFELPRLALRHARGLLSIMGSSGCPYLPRLFSRPMIWSK